MNIQETIRAWFAKAPHGTTMLTITAAQQREWMAAVATGSTNMGLADWVRSGETLAVMEEAHEREQQAARKEAPHA